MYKNRQLKVMLVILLILMGSLSFKLMFLKDKFLINKNTLLISSTKNKNVSNIEKYGYSDILELLRKNIDFEVKSINMLENEKCNVQVDYKGDTKLLYVSLISLNENENFLAINTITINNDDNIINVSIDFKKNK